MSAAADVAGRTAGRMAVPGAVGLGSSHSKDVGGDMDVCGEAHGAHAVGGSAVVPVAPVAAVRQDEWLPTCRSRCTEFAWLARAKSEDVRLNVAEAVLGRARPRPVVPPVAVLLSAIMPARGPARLPLP